MIFPLTFHSIIINLIEILFDNILRVYWMSLEKKLKKNIDDWCVVSFK